MAKIELLNCDCMGKNSWKRNGDWFDCWYCGKKLWRSQSRIKKGENKFCSKECYLKWQKGKPKISGFKLKPRNGKENPNWKGGLTHKNILIRNSVQYKKWRQNIFKRDDWTCQECGRRSCREDHVFIEAHHIKPFSTHTELRFDNNNAITLCKQCHSKKPKGREIRA